MPFPGWISTKSFNIKITKMKSYGTTEDMKGTRKSEATVFNPSWNIHASLFTFFTTLDVFTVPAKISQVLTSKWIYKLESRNNKDRLHLQRQLLQCRSSLENWAIPNWSWRAASILLNQLAAGCSDKSSFSGQMWIFPQEPNFIQLNYASMGKSYVNLMCSAIGS